MIKVIALLPKRSDLSEDDFARHLLDVHLPLVAALPGLKKLAVNWVHPDPSGAAPAYDAIAEDWFEDPAALQAALASPQAAEIGADAATFLDLARFQFLIVREESVPLGGPA